MEIKYFFSKRKATSGFNSILWICSKLPHPNLWVSNLLFTAIFLTCVGFFSTAILPKMYRWVENLPDYQISRAHLTIREVPAWLLPHTQEIVPIECPESISIFSGKSTQQIARAYLKNPWVKEVKQISIHYPNQIGVNLLLRRPVAWIHHPQGYFLSDISGVRLPGIYSLPVVTPEFLPIISGVECPLPEPGENWQDASLRIAVPLIHLLVQKGVFDNLPLQQVCLEKVPQCSSQNTTTANLNNDKRVVIVTSEATRIIWGRPDSAPVSLDRRLDALKQFCCMAARYGLNSNGGISEVDVQFGYVILRAGNKNGKNKNRKRTTG